MEFYKKDVVNFCDSDYNNNKKRGGIMNAFGSYSKKIEQGEYLYASTELLRWINYVHLFYILQES